MLDEVFDGVEVFEGELIFEAFDLEVLEMEEFEDFAESYLVIFEAF